MRSVHAAPFELAHRWIAGLGLAGLLISGCAPDEVQAPKEGAAGLKLDAAAAPTGGLIGEWKLDETGGTNANDSKNNYDATVFGGAAFVAGKLDNALNLNNGTAGTGGKYAQMPSNSTLDNVQEGNYTISACFHPATLPPDATLDNRHWAIVAKASPHLGIFYNAAGKFLARHYLTGTVGEQAASPTTYPAGAWYHVAGTVSKTTGTVKIYVNGVFQDQASFTANTTAEEYGTTPFQIGKSGPVWAANGKVDQVRIYNRELSAAAIDSLFDETSGPPPDAGLSAGLGGTTADDFGVLPSTANFYRAALVSPGTGAGDPRNIDELLSKANQFDITLVLRLSGAPGAYTDPIGTYVDNDGQTRTCSRYNPAKYQANLDRFEGHAGLEAALASRRAVVYVIDEPWINIYCNSISEDDVKQMGRWIKNRWPGAITAVRAPAEKMMFGWNPTKTTQFSTSYWNTIDYGWSQYNHVAALNSTPAQFYDDEKRGLSSVNLGMVPGINVWNGGNKTCWTQPDGRSGLIHGSEASPSSERGTFVPCPATPPHNSEVWVASPALLRSAIEAATADPDAPLFIGWTHVGPDDDASWSVMRPLENRSDFVNTFKYWNTHAASRSSWNGWRQAKQ